MGSIRSTIELQDSFSSVFSRFISYANASVPAVEQMQAVMSDQINTSPLVAVQEQIDSVADAARRLSDVMQNASGVVDVAVSQTVDEVQVNTPEEVSLPVTPVLTEQIQVNAPEDITVTVTPVVTEPPQVDLPDEVILPVTPVVTEQVQIDAVDEIEVTVNANVPELNTDGVRAYQEQIDVLSSMFQQIVSVQDTINTQSSNISVISDEERTKINSINQNIEVMEQALRQIEENPFNWDAETIRLQIVSLNDSLLQTAETQREINSQMQELTLPAEIWESDRLEVFVNTGIERFQQEIQSANSMMSDLTDTQSRINAAAAQMNILPENAINDLNSLQGRLQGVQQWLQEIENNPLNVGSDATNAGLERTRALMVQVGQAQQDLSDAFGRMDIEAANDAFLRVSQTISNVERYARENPVVIDVTWNSDSLPVFDGTGIERFEQEIQSANNMLNTLNDTQSRIAAAAAQTNIFPPNMVTDMNGMQNRLEGIQQRIQQIENNPLNMGSDVANAELERLRAQLEQAVQAQEMLNNAVENMDIQAAQQAYLQLSQTVSGTERYLRDNVDEQGRFNRAIDQGVKSSGNLQDNFSGMVKKLLGVASITALIAKAFNFTEECMEAFNVQNNAEIQLFSVLANNPDEELVSQFEAELAVDTSQAISDINGIQDEVNEVTVSVSARSQAVTAAFDEITEKASEIQSRGIYGDEIMIAAAAEFSTYFSDTDAVTMMMDTLTNYAMGMENGVSEVDVSTMVNYATNLGKIMTGSYRAMSDRGFEFTDAQKAIIDGEATQAQIVATLGNEYADLSSDMQKAAVITQVIDEYWAGLYENMSNTPEGKIIQLNNAWGDLTETIGGELYPYVVQFVEIINDNWPTIEEIVSGITMSLEFVFNVLSWVLEAVLGVAEYFTNNWPQIAPVITPIATAIGLVAAAVIAYKVAMGIATVAQWLFNSAMLANPVFWIILAIVLLIAIIYGLVGAINEAQGTSMSATGIICGVVMAAVATIGNIIGAMWNFIVDVFDSIWNVVALVANFLGNVFMDPIGSVCRLFFGLCDFVLSILQAIASAIDFIFGSDFADTIQGWRDGLNGWVEDTFGSDVVEVMPKADSKDLKWDRNDTEEWFNMGVEFGEGIDKTVSDFFDFSGLNDTDDIMEDLANRLGEQNDLTGGIYDNTDDILDAVEISEEDLKYLRDIAEQETVNRFTTAEIHIEQNNNNNISSSLDLDGVVEGLTDAVNEAVVIIAEGVHV